MAQTSQRYQQQQHQQQQQQLQQLDEQPIVSSLQQATHEQQGNSLVLLFGVLSCCGRQV